MEIQNFICLFTGTPATEGNSAPDQGGRKARRSGICRYGVGSESVVAKKPGVAPGPCSPHTRYGGPPWPGPCRVGVGGGYWEKSHLKSLQVTSRDAKEQGGR